MDMTTAAMDQAQVLYARANTSSQPAVYKVIGITLAIASGLFIGTSFVIKKVGLLKANVKYNEEAGEGYGYLKNLWWWLGMTLMIVGEICNFVAYCFVDAILVTPMGALSVVVTTILSAIFLKERLSFVGKIGCFNCIIGATIIALNAPEQASVSDIQGMQHYVIAPGFLTYAGVIILGCLFVVLWCGPRYGKKSMFVYISVCSLIGGLSVVATQGLGASILAQIRGESQFKHWFLYVLLVFVICSLLTEIIYLNKALNLFNAALVTPTYYVMFTSSTIVTSAVLFQGFSGSVMSIVTMVMGFLTICSGVVLLQLSKSAKDVPDAAVFKGDLDQIREVSEQEASEIEPKADAIRGAAAIIRRISVSRQKMEEEEAKRFFREKQEDQLSQPGDNEIIEWDGLRRRKTVIGDHPIMTPRSSRSVRTPHPPLGMSRFPTEDENMPTRTPSGNHSFLSDVRSRASTMLQTPLHWRQPHDDDEPQTSIHPVALTEIALNKNNKHAVDTAYHGGNDDHLEPPFQPHAGRERSNTPRSIVWADERPDSSPTRSTHLAAEPPHQSARRQFSFTTLFGRKKSHENVSHAPVSPGRSILRTTTPRRAVKAATEEERLGLVKGDRQSLSMEHDLDDDADEMGSLDEKIIRSSSPEMFDPAIDKALEDVKRQYNTARPHQVSTSSSISTTTFPPYEDTHHYYEQYGHVPQSGQIGGYHTIRRVSSPPPPPPSLPTRPNTVSSSISSGKMRMNNPLPPIPDTTNSTTTRDPGSDYVHVPVGNNPPAYSPEHGQPDDDEHDFNPSEFGVVSLPSSSSSTSPPSSSSAGRRYRDSYRRPGQSHTSNSGSGSRSRNITGQGQRRNPRSNSDSSTGSSASNEAGTQRLVREDAFI
uniref:Magnesium transporter NIPA2 n=1 Tax=Talaromyces marneffei PM1 TaxID=1077442 RepID=A0A093V4J9_TALMA